MGFVSFGEKSGQGGEANSGYQRSYTRIFEIVTDTATDTTYAVGSHPSLPAIFSVHPQDSRAFCTSLSPQQDTEDPTIWTVRASYGYQLDGWTMGGGGGGGTGNPLIDSQQVGVAPGSRVDDALTRPRDYKFGSVVTGSKVKWTDIYGNPTTNTVGDLIDPPWQEDTYGVMISVGLNSTTAPGNNWVLALGKLNSSTLVLGPWSITAKNARLRGIEASPVYESYTYYRWNLIFEVREYGLRSDPADPVANGWCWWPLNQGLRAKKTVGGVTTVQHVKDETGNYVTAPVPLRKDGFVVSGAPTFDADDNVNGWTGDDFFHNCFEMIPSVSFPSPL